MLGNHSWIIAKYSSQTLFICDFVSTAKSLSYTLIYFLFLTWFLNYVSRPESSAEGESSTTAVYRITGMVLGRTKLQFTANQKAGKEVSSPARDIQVFPPLRLAERNITLIVGAVFQVGVL